MEYPPLRFGDYSQGGHASPQSPFSHYISQTMTDWRKMKKGQLRHLHAMPLCNNVHARLASLINRVINLG